MELAELALPGAPSRLACASDCTMTRMMNVEQQLGMSLEELISLDAHEVPGRSLLHELRALDNNLSLADKLCMSIGGRNS